MPITPGPLSNGKPAEQPKSWKKINEERKALKRQRKQEKQIKLLEQAEEAKRLEELAKKTEVTIKENPSTISIAVPGSILENAQTAELRTYVAGQIARAACIFRVSEVIVFDDIGIATARETKRMDDDDEEGGTRTVRSSSLQLGRILQYLECPQYLRKFFFPLHKDLQYSGLLNPLDTPHHLRQQNSFIYREGIISDKKAKDGYSFVNVGFLNDVLVNKAIEPGIRVTVKLNNVKGSERKLRGKIVSPDEPRRETGVYWGYQVRIAHTLSEIFTKSPYTGGYDLTIGTSDRGKSVQEIEQKSLKFDHLLIVFGGLKGLEAALLNDEKLNVDDPALLFDHYVNVMPRQGSRTIRTEEALLIALAAMQEKFQPKVAEIEEDLSQFLPRSEDTSEFMGQPQFPRKQKKQKQQAHAGLSNDDVPAEKMRKMENDSANEESISNNEQPTKMTNKHDNKKVNPFDSSKKAETMPLTPNKREKKKNNPFGSAKIDNAVPVSETSSNIEAQDEFEIVSTTHNAKSKKSVTADDLSRFD